MLCLLNKENIPEAKFFKIAFRCLRNIEVVIPIRTKLRIINNTKKLNYQMDQKLVVTWWLKYWINMIQC